MKKALTPFAVPSLSLGTAEAYCHLGWDAQASAGGRHFAERDGYLPVLLPYTPDPVAVRGALVYATGAPIRSTYRWEEVAETR